MNSQISEAYTALVAASKELSKEHVSAHGVQPDPMSAIFATLQIQIEVLKQKIERLEQK